MLKRLSAVCTLTLTSLFSTAFAETAPVVMPFSLTSSQDSVNLTSSIETHVDGKKESSYETWELNCLKNGCTLAGNSIWHLDGQCHIHSFQTTSEEHTLKIEKADYKNGVLSLRWVAWPQAAPDEQFASLTLSWKPGKSSYGSKDVILQADGLIHPKPIAAAGAKGAQDLAKAFNMSHAYQWKIPAKSSVYELPCKFLVRGYAP